MTRFMHLSWPLHVIKCIFVKPLQGCNTILADNIRLLIKTSKGKGCVMSCHRLIDCRYSFIIVLIIFTFIYTVAKVFALFGIILSINYYFIIFLGLSFITNHTSFQYYQNSRYLLNCHHLGV